MSHTHAMKEQLQPRINRMKGQVEALQRALDQDKPCIEVLQQVAAIRGAVNGLMQTVLEEHVRHHLLEDSGDREESVEQVLKVLKSYLK